MKDVKRETRKVNGYSRCRCAVHIEDTAVIEWLLTRPERNVER